MLTAVRVSKDGQCESTHCCQHGFISRFPIHETSWNWRPSVTGNSILVLQSSLQVSFSRLSASKFRV